MVCKLTTIIVYNVSILLIFATVFIVQVAAAGDGEGKTKDEFSFEEYKSKVVTINVSKLKASSDIKSSIDNIVKAAEEFPSNGIYAKIPPEDKVDIYWKWIPELYGAGFRLQLAEFDIEKGERQEPPNPGEHSVIWMKKWLKNEAEIKSTIPFPAYTTIDIGIIVTSKDGKQVLLENNSESAQSAHKVPFRPSRPGETFKEAVGRILKELEIPQHTYEGILQVNHYPDGGQRECSKAHMIIYCLATIENTSTSSQQTKWYSGDQTNALSASDKNALHVAGHWKMGNGKLKIEIAGDHSPPAKKLHVKTLSLPSKVTDESGMQSAIQSEIGKLRKEQPLLEGLWAKVHIKEWQWLSSLWKEGFRYQFAVDESLKMSHQDKDVILMQKWLKGKPNKMPLPAFTTIGIGAIVVNQDGTKFLLKKKGGAKAGQREAGSLSNKSKDLSLPGRALLPGESFTQALDRILKEVGVTKQEHGWQLHGILEITQRPGKGEKQRSKDDMFIHFVLSMADNASGLVGSELVWKEMAGFSKDSVMGNLDKMAIDAIEKWLKKHGGSGAKISETKLVAGTDNSAIYVFDKIVESV